MFYFTLDNRYSYVLYSYSQDRVLEPHLTSTPLLYYVQCKAVPTVETLTVSDGRTCNSRYRRLIRVLTTPLESADNGEQNGVFWWQSGHVLAPITTPTFIFRLHQLYHHPPLSPHSMFLNRIHCTQNLLYTVVQPVQRVYSAKTAKKTSIFS